MKYKEQQIEWLSQILKERIGEGLRIESVSDIDGMERYVLKCQDECLEINKFNIIEVSGIQLNSLEDILDLVLFYLSRSEEFKSLHKDLHDRFPAEASKAYKDGTLDRPIVDECLEVIRKKISIQWPQYKLAGYCPKTIVTCDVDHPYEFYTLSKVALMRKLGADLLKRKSFNKFCQNWKNYCCTQKGNYTEDPNNTFDWMMDVNERAGNRMAFYFLVDNTLPAFDSKYSIDEPRIRKLIRNIYDRGHEIGLHASYGTYDNPAQMKKEADKLREVMDDEGIKQDEIGSRQHYLRWSTPETARHLEYADISYDTTLGYADHIGFRCGTSHDFSMFDIEDQRILKLRQRPLITMEVSIFNEKYMNMDYSERTLEYVKSIKSRCIKYGGNFNLLWHNSSLKSEKDKIFYQELINT